MTNLIYELGQGRVADLHREAAEARLARLAVGSRGRRRALRSMLPALRPPSTPERPKPALSVR